MVSDNTYGMPENERPGHASTILVVDDEQDITEVLSYLLTRAGYEVATAGSGRAAMDAVEKGGVDLVLLDYMLPDTNGLEVLRKIKSVSREIKVIIITGRATDRVLADVLDAGASGYVIKPFLNEKLLQLVREALA